MNSSPITNNQLMMNMFDRDLGKYPLSIGTSLTLETISGQNPDKPVKGELPIRLYETMLVSMRMVMRNIYQSITDRKVAEDLPDIDFYDAIMMEMRYIREVVAMFNPRMKVIFYAPTYRNLHKRFPQARIKVQRTSSTQKYADLEVNALKRFYSEKTTDIFRCDFLEKIEISLRTLVWTNSPLDLITLNKPLVSLLESHTGAIKDRSKWNSKYTGSKDFSNIPFNKPLLLIMGDGGYLLSPILRYKNRILKLAEANNWNFTTELSKIMRDAHLAGETELAEWINVARK